MYVLDDERSHRTAAVHHDLVEGHSRHEGEDDVTVITQDALKINERLRAIMAPHSGVGGWAPRPRKLKAAASRMAEAKLRVVWTMSGPRQLGKIAMNMISHSGYLKTGPRSPSLGESGKSDSSTKVLKSSRVSRIQRVEILFDFKYN